MFISQNGPNYRERLLVVAAELRFCQPREVKGQGKEREIGKEVATTSSMMEPGATRMGMRSRGTRLIREARGMSATPGSPASAPR